MAETTAPSLKQRITELYEGDEPASHKFRYGLLIFDLVTIAFVIISSFLQWKGTEVLDAVITAAKAGELDAAIEVAKGENKNQPKRKAA